MGGSLGKFINCRDSREGSTNAYFIDRNVSIPRGCFWRFSDVEMKCCNSLFWETVRSFRSKIESLTKFMKLLTSIFNKAFPT